MFLCHDGYFVVHCMYSVHALQSWGRFKGAKDHLKKYIDYAIVWFKKFVQSNSMTSAKWGLTFCIQTTWKMHHSHRMGLDRGWQRFYQTERITTCVSIQFNLSLNHSFCQIEKMIQTYFNLQKNWMPESFGQKKGQKWMNKSPLRAGGGWPT